MTTRPIQYQSSATWLSLCCQSDQTMPLRLLYCQWMTTRPIQYKSNATWPSRWCLLDQKIHSYYFTTNNDHLTNPVPVHCLLTVPVLPIKPQNAIRITLLPMNNHLTNSIPIQYHLTVTVMPIRPKINDHSTNLIQIQSHCTVTV